MRKSAVGLAALVLFGSVGPAAAADRLPAAAFAALPTIADAAVSADGRYIALVSATQGRRVAVVVDRRDPKAEPRAVIADPPKDFHIQWCRWVGTSRLLCSFRGVVSDGDNVYVATRLAAVDADGSHPITLLESSRVGAGQFQDNVVAWNTGVPDTVLVEAPENLLDIRGQTALASSAGGVVGGMSSWGFPALFDLNVRTGVVKLRERSREPIRWYYADRRGQPRLAWGFRDKSPDATWFVRTDAGTRWTELSKTGILVRTPGMHPIAVDFEDAGRAYAFGLNDGRQALWSLDLTDAEPPKLVFEHPAVDVQAALFSKDGRLLGVRYETDTPFVYYLDPESAKVIGAVRSVAGDRVIQIVDRASDGSVFLLCASSDVDAGTYYAFEPATGHLVTLGTARPALPPTRLARVTPVSYPARDGTRIPGYLTVPNGVRAERLPLVVLPHDGPDMRDSWTFDYLAQFIASRGYAVLQPNFRGSAGYGDAWYEAALQNWGGAPFRDIVDGVKWAAAEGIADPARVCMVGWGYGGYAALLAAVREPQLLRCAGSIGGISDLPAMWRELSRFAAVTAMRERIGDDTAQLAADSPRRQAGKAVAPILLVHGERDERVEPDQSRAMASALARAGRTHELLVLPGADHGLTGEADRARMLDALDKFLARHLGPGAGQ